MKWKVVDKCGVCGSPTYEYVDGRRKEDHTTECKTIRDLKARVEELEKQAKNQDDRISGLSHALAVVEDAVGILGP